MAKITIKNVYREAVDEILQQAHDISRGAYSGKNCVTSAHLTAQATEIVEDDYEPRPTGKYNIDILTNAWADNTLEQAFEDWKYFMK